MKVETRVFQEIDKGDGINLLRTVPSASFTLTAVDANGRVVGCNPDIVKASHELVNEILPKDGTIEGVKDVIISLAYKLDELEKQKAKLSSENFNLKAQNMQLSQNNMNLINQYNWNSAQRIELKERLKDLQNQIADLMEYKENFSELSLRKTIIEKQLNELHETINELHNDNGRVFYHYCARGYFGSVVRKDDMVKYLDIMYELATETNNGEYIISNKTDITALYIIMNKKNIFAKPSAFVAMWNANVVTRIGDEDRHCLLTIENTYITSAKSKAPFNNYGSPAKWERELNSTSKIEKRKVLERAERIKKSFDEKSKQLAKN